MAHFFAARARHPKNFFALMKKYMPITGIDKSTDYSFVLHTNVLPTYDNHIMLTLTAT